MSNQAVTTSCGEATERTCSLRWVPAESGHPPPWADFCNTAWRRHVYVIRREFFGVAARPKEEWNDSGSRRSLEAILALGAVTATVAITVVLVFHSGEQPAASRSTAGAPFVPGGGSSAPVTEAPAHGALSDSTPTKAPAGPGVVGSTSSIPQGRSEGVAAQSASSTPRTTGGARPSPTSAPTPTSAPPCARAIDGGCYAP